MALSEETYKSALYGPWLEVLGQLHGQLRAGEHTYEETIFIVRGLRNNLLRLPALVHFTRGCLERIPTSVHWFRELWRTPYNQAQRQSETDGTIDTEKCHSEKR